MPGFRPFLYVCSAAICAVSGAIPNTVIRLRKRSLRCRIDEIVAQVETKYKAENICLTGGEPLLYGDRSGALLEALCGIERIRDVHVETNGAIDLAPFLRDIQSPKARYIMDYKLPDSGENEAMLHENFALLRPQDEVKFVIASDADFDYAVRVLADYPTEALALFSPVWESMPPARLVEKMLEAGLSRVKLNMQLHKIIWDPAKRGV